LGSTSSTLSKELPLLEIWESWGTNVRLTAEQRAELARRDAELDANPRIALTWEQIRAIVEMRDEIGDAYA
jgi:putative addiction module component (TIGR02574 family)